ncbi:MAG: FAD-dependent thymidylate synthase [Nitrososphaerota archaeon]
MIVLLVWHTDPNPIFQASKKYGVTLNKLDLMKHIVYMFEIEDISRVTTHQLIRHRLASYDQESQRFSAASRETFVVPPSVSSKKESKELFEKTVNQVMEVFEKLVALGIPKEDARYIIPHSIKTKLVMTLSAASLQHIASLRTTPQAQWEIRSLVSKMYELAKQATPEIWNV